MSTDRSFSAWIADAPLLDLIFAENLHEFATRVTSLANLHHNGALPAHECFERLRPLWRKFTSSYHRLFEDTDAQPE